MRLCWIRYTHAHAQPEKHYSLCKSPAARRSGGNNNLARMVRREEKKTRPDFQNESRYHPTRNLIMSPPIMCNSSAQILTSSLNGVTQAVGRNECVSETCLKPEVNFFGNCSGRRQKAVPFASLFTLPSCRRDCAHDPRLKSKPLTLQLE